MISEGGSKRPESILFTLGLHIEAVLLAVFFLCVFAHIKMKIDRLELQQPAVTLGTESNLAVVARSCRCCCNQLPTKESMNFWNKVLLCVGCCASVLVFAIGSITLNVNLKVHRSIAVIMFVCIILHMVVFYFQIAWFLETRTAQLNAVKLCIFMCIPVNLCMVVAAWVGCNVHGCVPLSRDLLALSEYLTALCISVYVLQFALDLDCISLTVAADADDSRTTSSPVEREKHRRQKQQ